MISERYVAELMNEIAKIRSICGDLISYDWISVPLIYSQLVTLAVYSYFAAALFGRYINHDITFRGRKSNQIRLRCGCERCPMKLSYPCRQHLGKTHEFVDMGHQVSLVPLFLILEFSFFVGWLKVTTLIHIFHILSYGSGAEEGLELR